MLSVSSKNLCNTSLTSSSSASIIGNNNNLLIAILYCLPVKSLCVFKTVSKQWKSLISDPYFKGNYNLRNRRFSVPALFMKNKLKKAGCQTELEFETLVMDERKGIDYVSFNTPIAVNRSTRIAFGQSCNGLILCKVHDGPDGIHKPYVIYNPSMRRCKTLPSPPFRKTGIPHVLSATVAFDPVKSSYYEVVGVCSMDTNRDVMYHIEIYSSQTDSWRVAGDPFPFSSPGRLSRSGVYLNGSVHWIDQWSATLHYFDIGYELMKAIAMPMQPYPDGDYSRKVVYFGECRGHIHLMEMCEDDMPRFDILEMRTDHTGWNIKYYVDLSPLTTVYPGILLDRVFLSHRFELYVLLIEEGKDSSRLILWIGKNKVISFDLINKSFKEIYDVNPDGWVEGFEYMETLACA